MSDYGTTGDVAGIAARYTDSVTGLFTARTNPTLTEVDNLLNRVSGFINICLKGMGFTTPVTSTYTQTKEVLDGVAVDFVVQLVEGIRGTGRYAPTNKQLRGRNPLTVVYKEIKELLEPMAQGFEAEGVPRNDSPIDRLSFRELDENGNTIHPIFQRDAFGNTFKNWSGSS